MQRKIAVKCRVHLVRQSEASSTGLRNLGDAKWTCPLCS